MITYVQQNRYTKGPIGSCTSVAVKCGYSLPLDQGGNPRNFS